MMVILSGSILDILTFCVCYKTWLFVTVKFEFGCMFVVIFLSKYVHSSVIYIDISSPSCLCRTLDCHKSNVSI